jgi:Plasmid stabilization system protein
MIEKSEYSLLLAQKAKKDLRDIHAYIEQELQEPQTADNVLDRIVAAIDSLSHMPRRNVLLKDAGMMQRRIRREVVDNYLIFYSINEEVKLVKIIRILYNRRDWMSII